MAWYTHFLNVMETDALEVTNTRLLEIIWWNSGMVLASIMFFGLAWLLA